MMSKLPSEAACISGNLTHPPLKLRGGERRGYALLLAVLILSTVLAGATALANIVISGIRQTRAVSNSIIAYAAAESDVELALYELRKGEDGNTVSHELQNGVIREVKDDQPIVHYRIAENDFVSLPIASTFSGNIQIPQWTVEQNCASSWIEISFVTLDLASGTVQDTLRQAQPLSAAPLSIQPPANTVELRIRALYCDISALTVNNLTIQSRVIIKSTAEVAGAKQAIEVTVPREAPAAGLFDFVLFSEEDLNKDVK